jgi:hypothetical protein
MGFGKLVVDDYRVKDYRIQRVDSTGQWPVEGKIVDGISEGSAGLSRNNLLRGGISSMSGTRSSRDLAGAGVVQDATEIPEDEKF